MKQDAENASSNNGRSDQAAMIHRLVAGQACESVEDRVVVEQAVTIMVDDVGSFTVLCTPSDVEALAVGFAFSEGIIDGVQDILSYSTSKADPNVVGLKVDNPVAATAQRNLIIASSCGLCGSRSIEKNLSRMAKCSFTLEVSLGLLNDVVDRMHGMQTVFHATGAAHAAGVFDETGSIFAFAEDIGRHNAVDKAVGKCLLAGRPTVGAGIVVSGRVSYEIAAKAARAGIELIAAVSAPSSMAIQDAERWNMTLCGFVRSRRANVYTHPQRIVDLNGSDDQRPGG